MNHSFFPSAFDISRCGAINVGRLCQHPQNAHGDEAECDYCDYKGAVNADANNGLACPDCITKVEKKVYDGPIKLNEVLRQSREIDYTVQVKTDVFNLETVSITELRESIWSDESITNKPSKLAETCYDRFNHFKKVIFDLGEQTKEAHAKQRAYQVELNKIVNDLRAEEREKYRILDINYKPAEPKKEVKVKKISVKVKIDKTELREAAKELGVAEYTLQSVCVSKNYTVAQAKAKLSEMMNRAKEESNGQTEG